MEWSGDGEGRSGERGASGEPTGHLALCGGSEESSCGSKGASGRWQVSLGKALLRDGMLIPVRTIFSSMCLNVCVSEYLWQIWRMPAQATNHQGHLPTPPGPRKLKWFTLCMPLHQTAQFPSLFA